MAKKTYYVERLGIRVDGFRTVTEARKAWEAKRDEFCERASQGPHVFRFAGFTCVVAPSPHGWEYTIVESGRVDGIVRAQCHYGAASQVEAIAVAVGAVAQRAWPADVQDDSAFFDYVAWCAGLRPAEVKSGRDDFVYLARHWRATQAAA